MRERIRRVGLTAKRGLTAASRVIAEVAAWLESRGVRVGRAPACGEELMDLSPGFVWGWVRLYSCALLM